VTTTRRRDDEATTSERKGRTGARMVPVAASPYLSAALLAPRVPSRSCASTFLAPRLTRWSQLWSALVFWCFSARPSVRSFPLGSRIARYPRRPVVLGLTHSRGSTSLVDLVDPMADGQWRSRVRGRRGEARETRETRRSVAKQLKGFTMARARLIKRGSRAKLSGSLESALACSRVHSRANGRSSMENAIGSG